MKNIGIFYLIVGILMAAMLQRDAYKDEMSRRNNYSTGKMIFDLTCIISSIFYCMRGILLLTA